MSAFSGYPELCIDEADGQMIICFKSGRVVASGSMDSREDIERLVTCWNACRKIFAPAAHLEATDAQVHKLENLRKEAWSTAAELQAEIDRLKSDGARTIVIGEETIAALRVGKEVGIVGGTFLIPASDLHGADGWRFDVDAAPRDRRLWLATKCGKLSVTRWSEKRSAWEGLADREQPIAWQAYVMPTHPHVSNPEVVAA